MTVLMGSLSLMIVFFLKAIGYNATNQSVTGKVKNYVPLYFFGSLFGLAAFLYKVGQYVLQNAIQQYPEILKQLSLRDDYERHKIENEVVQFLKAKEKEEERRVLKGGQVKLVIEKLKF